MLPVVREESLEIVRIQKFGFPRLSLKTKIFKNCHKIRLKNPIILVITEY